MCLFPCVHRPRGRRAGNSGEPRPGLYAVRLDFFRFQFVRFDPLAIDANLAPIVCSEFMAGRIGLLFVGAVLLLLPFHRNFPLVSGGSLQYSKVPETTY